MNIHEISKTNKLIYQMYTSDSENLVKKLQWVQISWIILKEWENWRKTIALGIHPYIKHLK